MKPPLTDTLAPSFIAAAALTGASGCVSGSLVGTFLLDTYGIDNETTGTPVPTTLPTQGGDEDDSGDFSTGGIVLLAVGAVVGVFFLIALAYFTFVSVGTTEPTTEMQQSRASQYRNRKKQAASVPPVPAVEANVPGNSTIIQQSSRPMVQS